MELPSVTKKRQFNVFRIRCFCDQRTDLVYSQLDGTDAVNGSKLVSHFHTTSLRCISVGKDFCNPAATIIFVKQNFRVTNRKAFVSPDNVNNDGSENGGTVTLTTKRKSHPHDTEHNILDDINRDAFVKNDIV